MKKIVANILIVVCILFMIGCGSTGRNTTAEICSKSGCDDEVYKDGLCPDHYVAAKEVAASEAEHVQQNGDGEPYSEDKKESKESGMIIEPTDKSIGLKNIKFDTSKDLTDAQKMVAEYFNKDYLFVNDIESLQRYNKIFDNALIMSYVYVEKVIAYNDDEYELLVKLIHDSEELVMYPEYLDNTRRMIIKGMSENERFIVGDTIQINGRYTGVETKTIDGESITTPIINVAKAYIVDMEDDPDAWWYVENPSRFTMMDVKKIAKQIFGDDIMIRKDSIEDYTLADTSYYLMDYQEVVGSDVEGYDGPCYVCELDNQTNAKFSKYFFNERYGTMRDAVHDNYEISFSGDFQHFYLFMYDAELESLTLEYYDNKLNKLWKREFEETTSATYDVTEKNIYLAANNEFYIINCETGEDVIDSIYIGEKLDIRKFEDGILAIASGKSDAFMFIGNDGEVRWKVNASADILDIYTNSSGRPSIQTQQVGGNIIITTIGDYVEDSMYGWGYKYYYYVISVESGELLYDGSIVTSEFQRYG